ncbi:hypothetical protein B0X78_03015 [bacterium AM6]|nr:hypothetical protein B0X78_03015 [bacterium AM6]
MADIYQDMVQPRGAAYSSDRIKSWSHYREPIDQSDGRLHGNSRRWGDATPEVQSRVIDTLIESAREKGLTPRETAHVLAIARVESGFNPDAAAGTTSASGLGQFIDKTGNHYHLNNRNRFDVAPSPMHWLTTTSTTATWHTSAARARNTSTSTITMARPATTAASTFPKRR